MKITLEPDDFDEKALLELMRINMTKIKSDEESWIKQRKKEADKKAMFELAQLAQLVELEKARRAAEMVDSATDQLFRKEVRDKMRAAPKRKKQTPKPEEWGSFA